MSKVLILIFIALYLFLSSPILADDASNDNYIDEGYSRLPDYMGHGFNELSKVCNFHLINIFVAKDNVCRISYPQGEDKYLIALNKCPNKKKCDWKSDLEVPIKYCDQEKLGIPGDWCQLDNSCLTKQCKLGRCVGRFADEVCLGHSDCDVGLSCNSGKCKEQSNNQYCFSDYNCKNGYGCSAGTCIKYASLELYSATTRPIFCKSLKSYNGKCLYYYYYITHICQNDSDCAFYYNDENGVYQTGYSKCICPLSFFDYSIGKLNSCEADSNFNGMQIINKVIDLNLHTYNRFNLKYLSPKEIYELKFPLYKQYDSRLITKLEDLDDDSTSFVRAIYSILAIIVLILII